ncbi:ABC transporter ATP-binding protein [Nocardioides sp. W7]|uniref:ABC transporter transmembrane domain-containing protein n=1 Tax=Nocardioides sp. W7 TaxID=2931390 RepID=UPI001FD5EADA|nr:ABC transporter ATP-binding protein [Nocardioides sp. W7]
MPGASETPATVVALYRRTLRRHRGPMLRSIGLVAVWNICEALVPVAIGLVIDDAVATGDGTRLLLWFAVLVVLFLVLSTGYRYGSRAGYAVAQYESHLLRGEVVRRVLDPRGSTRGRLPGETLSVATSDAELAADVMRMIGFAIAAVGAIAVAAVYLLRVDLLLGLVVLLGVPLVLGVVQLLAPRMSRDAGEQQGRIARASGLAADLVAGLRVLKGVGGETAATRTYTEASEQAVGAGILAARSTGLMTGTTTALSGVFLAAVALLAGHRALDGDITIGQFIAVVGLAQFLGEPLRSLGEIAAYSATCWASGRRVVEVLGEPYAVVDAGASDVAPGPLEVPGLLRAEPGELVGVVLADPTGGDRLLDELAGVVPAPGIRIGGVALDEVGLAARRAHVLVVRHHVDVFEGTLRSNVRTHGEPDWPTVLSASALDDVVELDPAGLDREVAAGGTSLSGGQRQRLALARALAARPPVLVLQDPTTAVDAVTEHDIAARLRAALPADGIAVVLTSSPALLAVADRVVHVSADGCVGTGPHVDLLARDPAYRTAVLR